MNITANLTQGYKQLNLGLSFDELNFVFQMCSDLIGKLKEVKNSPVLAPLLISDLSSSYAALACGSMNFTQFEQRFKSCVEDVEILQLTYTEVR
jgi:hypothetical protein